MNLSNPLSRALIDSVPAFSTAPCCWIALSGGADSMALAHALVQLKQAAPHHAELAWLQTMPLRAIHVHHGLSDQADAWQQHVTDYCEQWQLPLQCVAVTVDRQGQGLEAAARAERYRAFAAQLNSGDVLITAHHQDDQAETLLLNLLRGAGLRGLAAMRPQRALANGQLLRPFLALSRRQLVQYCQQHQLQFVDDPSNQDAYLRRSFLRQQCLPLLRQHWPEASASLAQSAQHLAEYEAYFEQRELATLTRYQADQKHSALPMSALNGLPNLLQRRLLATWLRVREAPAAPAARMTTFLQQLQALRSNLESKQNTGIKSPVLSWRRWQLRCYAGQLHLLAPGFLGAQLENNLSWSLSDTHFQHPWFGELSLLGNDVLAEEVQCAEPRVQWSDLSLAVRARSGGERILDASGKHLSVKKLLQAHGIAPWLRERIPLLFNGEELWAVGDLRMHPEFIRLCRLANCRLSWRAAPAEPK